MKACVYSLDIVSSAIKPNLHNKDYVGVRCKNLNDEIGTPVFLLGKAADFPDGFTVNEKNGTDLPYVAYRLTSPVRLCRDLKQSDCDDYYLVWQTQKSEMGDSYTIKSLSLNGPEGPLDVPKGTDCRTANPPNCALIVQEDVGRLMGHVITRPPNFFFFHSFEAKVIGGLGLMSSTIIVATAALATWRAFASNAPDASIRIKALLIGVLAGIATALAFELARLFL